MQKSTHRAIRPVIGAAAALAAAITLVGCQASDPSVEGKTLTIDSTWIKGDVIGDVFREQVARFEEETGVKVEVKDIPNSDLVVALEADYIAGSESDILITNITNDQSHWTTQGMTADVSSYLTDWGLLDNFDESVIGEWTNSDGQVRGFPYQGITWPIWYNQALFDEAGVDIPTTFDELLEASDALQAAGIDPFAVAGGDWPGGPFFQLVSQSYMTTDETASLIRDDGNFCSVPAFMDGLGLVEELLANGALPSDVAGFNNDAMVSAYFNGEAAMAHLGSWQYPAAPADIQANTVLGGFPTVDGGAFAEPTMFSTNTGQGVWITRNGEENIDAVKEFVEFLYDDETISAFVAGADLTPAMLIGDDVTPPSNPLQQQSLELRSTFDQGTSWDAFRPTGWNPAPIFQAVYAGSTTAEAACAELESTWKTAKNG